MTKTAGIVGIKLTTVQFWILYLLAWRHYQALLQGGVQDDDWRNILFCLQGAYEDTELHKTIA